MTPDAAAIAAALRGVRLSMKTEKDMQDDVESCLSAQGWMFQRECRLTPQSRPDFLVVTETSGAGVVIELKLKGGKRPLVEQVLRYAKHPMVTALVVVSAVRTALPPEIEGKPVHYVSPGEAWL